MPSSTTAFSFSIKLIIGYIVMLLFSLLFNLGYTKNCFQALDGDYKASVKLNPGDFLICYPEDAHRTGVIADEACHLKKAIFKIKVED